MTKYLKVVSLALLVFVGARALAAEPPKFNLCEVELTIGTAEQGIAEIQEDQERLKRDLGKLERKIAIRADALELQPKDNSIRGRLFRLFVSGNTEWVQFDKNRLESTKAMKQAEYSTNQSLESIKRAMIVHLTQYLRDTYGDEYLALNDLEKAQKEVLVNLETYIENLNNAHGGAGVTMLIEAVNAAASFAGVPHSALRWASFISHRLYFEVTGDDLGSYRQALADSLAHYISLKEQSAKTFSELSLDRPAPETFYLIKTFDFLLGPQTGPDVLSVFNVLRLLAFIDQTNKSLKESSALKDQIVEEGRVLRTEIEEILCREKGLCNLPQPAQP
jgi:hypothetical protein